MALKRFDNQHLPLDLFLSNYFRAHPALGSKDRQKIAEAAFGMLRWKGLIDFLIGERNSWEHRHALYKGFQPSSYLYVSTIPLHVRVSFPEMLFQKIHAQYGEEKAIALAAISNTQAPVTIRINPLKTTREKLLEKWAHLDAAPSDHSPLGIQFKKRENFFGMPEFKEGLFEMQDEASQLVALHVKAKPGDLVLDYCAGSGGKTLAFAHHLQGQGQIFLHDSRQSILEQAKKRLRRAGIQNAQILPPDSPTIENLQNKMDWVLVDAPCSGSGTLRRNPDLKWKFSEEMLSELLASQRSIFEKALSFLSSRGRIVYATCSILTEENEKQIKSFMSRYNLCIEGSPFISLPTFGGMDGFFAITLKRAPEKQRC